MPDSFRLTPELRERLKETALDRKVSRSHIVKTALADYFHRIDNSEVRKTKIAQYYAANKSSNCQL
jgi:predicted transcriptional regulator